MVEGAPLAKWVLETDMQPKTLSSSVQKVYALVGSARRSASKSITAFFKPSRTAEAAA